MKKLLLSLLLILALAPSALALSLEDGEYSVSLDISGGSGKASIVSPALLTVRDGQPMVRLTWSSANYDYMIVDDVRYENLSEEGMNSRFEVPITQWDEPMPVIADTLAMGAPVEIRYQLIFYSDTLGSKSQLPQEASKRVLMMAAAIIVLGGIANYYIKKKNAC